MGTRGYVLQLESGAMLLPADFATSSHLPRHALQWERVPDPDLAKLPQAATHLHPLVVQGHRVLFVGTAPLTFFNTKMRIVTSFPAAAANEPVARKSTAAGLGSDGGLYMFGGQDSAHGTALGDLWQMTWPFPVAGNGDVWGAGSAGLENAPPPPPPGYRTRPRRASLCSSVLVLTLGELLVFETVPSMFAPEWRSTLRSPPLWQADQAALPLFLPIQGSSAAQCTASQGC